MLEGQQANGKALEYACAAALQRALAARRVDAKLLDTNASRTAARRFAELSAPDRADYNLAAEACARALERLEPTLQAPLAAAPVNKSYTLIIQADAQGEVGDVRDIIVRDGHGWELGLSIKHNNDIAKNPRLASNIDFGAQWFKHPCDAAYFADIKHTFDELEALAQMSAHWDSLGLSEHDKTKRFYRPVMEAFMVQLTRSSRLYADMPAALFRYLLGRQDFYKVIALGSSRTTHIEAFSFSGALGQPSGNIKPLVNIPRLPIPNTITSIAFKPYSDNTIIITFDQNWATSLRLHNASSRVERSLKLDVRLVDMPPVMLKLTERWRS